MEHQPGRGEPQKPAGTERARRWAATMGGFSAGVTALRAGDRDPRRRGNGQVLRIRLAHADSHAPVGPPAEGGLRAPMEMLEPGELGLAALHDRTAREELEVRTLSAGATRALGAGRRLRPEEADEWRTCFERDRDRVLHATAFRRLAGKTQVFVFPEDHQRTRLTHALEVAQVAGGVARACRLNVALTEAIALGHDCGHGPGGHASEDALDPLVPGGFDHAPWGAEVSLAHLNLCAETLDGIANHSWSRPAPATPEGEVVSWADRIAYVCHDWEDAVRTGVVHPSALPASVRRMCGTSRAEQLGTFIRALVTSTLTSGQVGMEEEVAQVLADFRAANYEHIYLRDESLAQGAAVVSVLQALVHHYADRPSDLPLERPPVPGSEAALRAAVTYVAGMTDRFAFHQAVEILGWDHHKLPHSIGD